MLNIRAKGQGGEREIATILNGIVILAMRELGFPESSVLLASSTIQRNQQQSAVGGSDLLHTFGLSIEVKRQEQLSIETWWLQCTTAAKRNNEWPVLLYRQNHKPWRCVTYMSLPMPFNEPFGHVMAEMSYPNFQMWFKAWVLIKLRQGDEVRI
jgi:hypothetical protein